MSNDQGSYLTRHSGIAIPQATLLSPGFLPPPRGLGILLAGQGSLGLARRWSSWCQDGIC